jgi:hypothetical protein
MRTASPKLARIKADFERVRKVQNDFVYSLESLQRYTGKKYVAIGPKQREILCEMAFVVLFTAWEQFLESAFETFVVEAPLSSFKTRHRVLVVDMDTAHDLIRGSRPYVDWSAQAVRDRAGIFFKRGEPFESALSSVTNDLARMKTIRNRCVHFSQHAAEQYEKMMRQVLGSGQHIAPGKLLMNVPPSGLSTASNATGYDSVFALYSEILSTAACQIVPKRTRS